MHVAVYAPDLNQDRLDAPQRCVKAILSVWNDADNIDYTVLTHETRSSFVCLGDTETIPERPIKKERAISRLNPDVVYTVRPRGILFPILIDAPVLLAYHGDVQIVEPQLNYGPYPRLFSFKQQMMELPQFPQFDGVTCVSKDLAERVRKRRFRPPVWVVHNGVDIDRFTPTVTSELNLPDRYILHLSAFSRRKNPTGVIRVFAEIKSDIDAQLVIAGGGWELEPRVQSLVESLNLEDRIVFLGYVPDEEVPGLYSDAGAFLFPSYHECFGLPVLEAMACGTPVVASTAYSLPEVVGDAGLFADPDDYETLSSQLYQLLTNHEYAADYSEQGRNRAKKFTWEKTTNKLRNVFSRITNQ